MNFVADFLSISELQLLLIACGVALLVPLPCWLLWPRLTGAILSDLRVPRILHYVALAGMGAALWFNEVLPEPDQIFSTVNILYFTLFTLTLTYAAVFAIVVNNIEDVEADRITNQSRPLVRETVQPWPYLMAGLFCQLVGLLLAFAGGIEMLTGIATISAIYYLYSGKPFRLKKIPILSKLLIGVNSFVVALTGWIIYGGDLWDFPLPWAIFILVPLALAANFVDLKDTEGDRATGIATLPVLLGEPKARAFIAVCTVAAYSMAAMLLSIEILYPVIAALTGAHVYLLYRKPYQEKPVFLVYVTALFGLDVFLLTGSWFA